MIRYRKNSRKIGWLFIAIIIVTIIIITTLIFNKENAFINGTSFGENNSGNISAYSNQNNLPDKLVELLEKNPETREFVLNYHLNKGKNFEIDLSEYENSEHVPLLMQWDERWGYNQYAGDLMGLTGCGPTCLSMVSIYLLNDAKYTPKYVAEFSERNGYSVPGNGSAWRLIPEGGKELGLDVIEIPLDENRIIRNLKVGNPIICVMGPGDFTTSGHFIVMTEYADGKIKVNDPNSKARSEKLWNLSDIKYQIRNLWVCRK